MAACRIVYQVFTHRTDHDLDHLDPNLPFRDLVQDLYGTAPTLETRARSRRLYDFHPATWSR